MNVIDSANQGDEFTFNCGGINWEWFLTIRVGRTWGDRTVEIVRYNRMHKNETGQPECVPGVPTLYENSARTVVAIRLGDRFYPVDNPQHVFSYKRG